MKISRLFEASNRAMNAYDDAKSLVAEKAVDFVESKTNPLIPLGLGFLLLGTWIIAIFSGLGLEQISRKLDNLPFLGPLVVSYFFFFIGSKLIFKPTNEEVTDDTSSIAIFSACRRRSRRSVVSLALSVLHTAVFIAFLLVRDL